MLYWNLCLSMVYQINHIVKRRSLAVVSDSCKELHEKTLEYVTVTFVKFEIFVIQAQNKLFLSFNDFLEIKSAVASMTCLLSEVKILSPTCK